MNNPLSESEEMYLATIARLQETGQPGPSPISRLADELAVQPVSANQMVRKLMDCGLVTYTPYKGVALTDDGRDAALRILRHRRLWEVFLVENLGYLPQEADQLACRLEHTLPAEAAERLANFLGNPVVSPSQMPIPPAEPLPQRPAYLALSRLNVNTTAVVMEITADSAIRSFLDLQGIRRGVQLSLLASANSGELLVRSATGNTLLISTELGRAIQVKPE